MASKKQSAFPVRSLQGDEYFGTFVPGVVANYRTPVSELIRPDDLDAAIDDVEVTATGGSTARSLADWLAGYEKENASPPLGGFYTDQGAPVALTHRFRDRVLVGNASVMNATLGSSPTADTWIPAAANGPDWIPREGVAVVMTDHPGKIAISGLAYSEGAGTGAASIGVAGFALAKDADSSAWAGYFDLQYEATSNGRLSYGLEIAVKNKGDDRTSTPYAGNPGTYGIYLAGGGDNAYGGAATNPSNTALYVGKNDDYGWNKGLVFGSTGLTGTDGGNADTGSGTAIEMAKQHQIRWLKPDGNVGAFIKSTVTNAGIGGGLLFSPTGIGFYQADGSTVAASITHTATAVNMIDMFANAAGSAPRVRAIGSDANIDLYLQPQGTGVVRFGTVTGSGDVAVNGYVTIKDAAGATVKLATVA